MSKSIISELKVNFEILKVVVLNENQVEIKIKIDEPNGKTQIEDMIIDLEINKDK